MKKITILLLTLMIIWAPYFPAGNVQIGVIEYTKLSSENVTGASACYLTENYAVWTEQLNGSPVLMAYNLTTKERFRLSSKDVRPGYQSENRLYASGDYCAFFNTVKTGNHFAVDVYGYDIKNKKEFKLNKKMGKGQNLSIWKNYVVWPDMSAGILLADIKKPDKEPIVVTNNKQITYVQMGNGYVVWEHRDQNKPPDPANFSSGEKLLAYEIATGNTLTVAEKEGFYSSVIISGNNIFYTLKKQANSYFCSIMGYDIAIKAHFTVLEMSPVTTLLYMNPNVDFLQFKNTSNGGSFACNHATNSIIKVSQGSWLDFYSGGCAWGNFSVSCRTVSPAGVKFAENNGRGPHSDHNLELFDIRDGKTIVLADARLGLGYRTRCRTNGEYVIFQQNILPNFNSEIMLVKIPTAKLSSWVTKENEPRSALAVQIISEPDKYGFTKAKTQDGEILLTFANSIAENSNIIAPGNMCYLVGVLEKNKDGIEVLNVEVSKLIDYQFPRKSETKGVCGIIVKKVEELRKIYITGSDGYDWIIKTPFEMSQLFWDDYVVPGKYLNAFGWAENDDAGYKILTAYGVSNRNCPCLKGYNTSEIEADNKVYYKNGERSAFNTAPSWAEEDILVELEALNNIIGSETSIMLSEDFKIVFNIKCRGHKIMITPGSKTAKLDDKEFQLTATPIKMDNTNGATWYNCIQIWRRMRIKGGGKETTGQAGKNCH
jgi:hypothetical protein